MAEFQAMELDVFYRVQSEVSPDGDLDKFVTEICWKVLILGVLPDGNPDFNNIYGEKTGGILKLPSVGELAIKYPAIDGVGGFRENLGYVQWIIYQESLIALEKYRNSLLNVSIDELTIE